MHANNDVKDSSVMKSEATKPIKQDNQDSQQANKTRNLLEYLRITSD